MMRWYRNPLNKSEWLHGEPKESCTCCDLEEKIITEITRLKKLLQGIDVKDYNPVDNARSHTIFYLTSLLK